MTGNDSGERDCFVAALLAMTRGGNTLLAMAGKNTLLAMAGKNTLLAMAGKNTLLAMTEG